MGFPYLKGGRYAASMPSLTSREVLDDLPLSYRQLDRLVRAGILRGEVRAAPGKGGRRLYEPDDVIALRVVAALRRCGMPVAVLRRHAPNIRAACARSGPDQYLIADRERVRVVSSRDLMGAIRGSAAALVLAMRAVLVPNAGAKR